jgi:hypothetical protein
MLGSVTKESVAKGSETKGSVMYGYLTAYGIPQTDNGLFQSGNGTLTRGILLLEHNIFGLIKKSFISV